VVLKPGDVVSLGEQIVLMYDAINIDPGVTVAVSRKSVNAAVPPPMQAAAPVYAATPAYSGAPVVKKTTMLPIFIGVGVLLFLCMCGGFFWWVDATFRWCVFFPFLSGC